MKYAIGFAAETENVIENAKKKLVAKNIDINIANFVGNNIRFNSDENALTLITKDGTMRELAAKHKNVLACEILTFIASLLL